jgi:hypothetical protein
MELKEDHPMFDPYHKWLSISRDQRPPTHYQLLGIAPDEDDPEVIDEAAICQTAHVRTYQSGPQAQECSRLLNEIALARATLLDSVRRRAYNAGLQIGKDEPLAYPETGEASWDLLGDLEVACPPRLGRARRSRRARARGIGTHSLVIFVVLNAISLTLLIWFLSHLTSAPAKPSPYVRSTQRQSRKPADDVKPRTDLQLINPRNAPAQLRAGPDSPRDQEERRAVDAKAKSGNHP